MKKITPAYYVLVVLLGVLTAVLRHSKWAILPAFLATVMVVVMLIAD